jgi:leucyl aminopeptidase (aminopeptidase T)
VVTASKLKENGLMSDQVQQAIERLLKVNLGLQQGERLLLFTDQVRDEEELSVEQAEQRRQLWDTVQEVREVAEGLTSVQFATYPATGSHGAELPEALWRIALGDGCIDRLAREGLLEPLLGKRATPLQGKQALEIAQLHREEAFPVVVALAHFSTSHTQFRKMLTDATKARYASMPRFEREMLLGAMSADWNLVARRTRLIRDKINGQVGLVLSAPNGTDFRTEATPGLARADTGILVEPGASGNLPAGEAFTVPGEGTATGRLVLNWAPHGPMDPPLTLVVEGGEVIAIEGDNPYRSELEARFAADPKTRNIAELGIGTNECATRPDNILESEKILGTVHLALGDNHSMGGKVSTNFHQDFVIFEPTLTIEHPGGKREILIEAGKVRE